MHLLALPLDVITLILQYSSVSELRTLMFTCKKLKKLIENDNLLWRRLYKDKLIVNGSSDNNKTSSFAYYHKCRVSHNWCRGIYTRKRVLYHTVNYMPWLKFLHSQALFLSIGSELQCFPTDKRNYPYCKDITWALQVPTVKRNDVRTNDISRFVIRNNFIVCGNRDGCAALYKLGNVRRRPRLVTHIRDCHNDGAVEVSAVELMNNKDHPCVVTASYATPVIKYWCSSGVDPLTTQLKMMCVSEAYVGDNLGVRCLALNEDQDKMAVGLDGNSQPYLLDTNTNQLLLTFENTKNPSQAIRDIQWHNENTMMYVTHSGKCQMLDIRSGEMVYDVMDPLNSVLYCVKSDGENAIVVGSAEYSRCVLFDFRHSADQVQLYFTQKNASPVYCLDFDCTKLIAAADRSLAVLNFNVNITSVKRRDYWHNFEKCSAN